MTEASLAQELAAIRAQLETQRARNEIYDCIVRFYRGVDRLDRELMLSAFHPGARDNHGRFDGPAEEFVDWAIGHLTGSVLFSVHHVGNVLIKFDGEVAYCESHVFAIERHTTADGEKDNIAHGRLLDRFEQRDGEWRIAERHLVGDWLRVEPVAEVPGGGLLANMLLPKRSKEDASYLVFDGKSPA